MQANTYDAIVGGSGMAGGWAAKELAERGLSTLVLEAGRPIDPARDYIEHEPIYEFKFRGLGSRRQEQATQFIQSKAGPCEEQTSHFFVNDVANPYTSRADKPFYWIRGRHLGGRSVMWGRQAAGARDIATFVEDTAPGLGIHEMGTACMGRDPKTSVLNAHNQCWDVKNVFVTDGACMTSSGCQNPSITYMALTARAAAYAVERMQRGEL